MKSFNVAILGCGTVGGGLAKILTTLQKENSERASSDIRLTKIVELSPKTAAEKFEIPLNLFCGDGNDLSKEDASNYIKEVIEDDNINLVVETIGGTSDFVYNIVLDSLNAGKHVVTANKALLAERGKEIYAAAKANNVRIGYEAAVCGAIPIIKTIIESFSGDEIISLSGIMNGTSNYILSRMRNENLSFDEALKLAQENGYAEADPTLDINGGDAAHKIIILMKLAFGIEVTMDEIPKEGIENISEEFLDFANEIGCTIKLICFAKKQDNKVFATVQPMMVKNSNLISNINGATNAVRAINLHAGEQILIGEGAGSSETASSIAADIVYIARYADKQIKQEPTTNYTFADAKDIEFSYIITFRTEDTPGITGLITTAIGNQNINIDTVSHNRHNVDDAVFSIVTEPCTLLQINKAVAEIEKSKPGVLIGQPKIMPVIS